MTSKELEKRLTKERSDLLEDRNKLESFIRLLDTGKIDYKDCYNSRSLLVAQLFAMDTYIQLLTLRLSELLTVEDIIHES